MSSFLEIKDQCLLKLIWETRARTNIIILLSTLYTVLAAGIQALSAPPFCLFCLSPIPSDAHTKMSRRECAWAYREKGLEEGGEKRSRMDSATRSWCNCMLMECASEYGIRMEAVRFDIPFCLRSSSLLILHLYLVIWSSFRICLFLSSLSWATRARLLRRHCMRIENYPSPVLFSVPWDHLRSRPLVPRLLIPPPSPSLRPSSLSTFVHIDTAYMSYR